MANKRSPEVLALLKKMGLPAAFPLTPMVDAAGGGGRWKKKVRGRVHYFGPLSNPNEALAAYRSVESDLKAGLDRPGARKPIAGTIARGPRPEDVRNLWVASKQLDAEAGLIQGRTLATYVSDSRELVAALPAVPIEQLDPDDFRRAAATIRAAHGSPVVAKRVIATGRQMLDAAWDEGMLTVPARYGKGFRGATKRERRVAQRAAGARQFGPDDVRATLDVARLGCSPVAAKRKVGGQPGVRPHPSLYAAGLLAINGGFTQQEVAELELTDVDLDAGLIDYDRRKTGVRRVVPLWPETVEAIRDALRHRPRAKHRGDARLLLLTSQGLPWVHGGLQESVDADGKVQLVYRRSDSLGLAWSRAAKAAGVKVKGAGFGKLRATHRTTSDSLGDTTAARCVMGQDPPGIDAEYVRNLNPQRLEAFLPRLQAVTECVRLWLWPELADQRPDVVGRIG